jgi:hypothetical protein
MIFDFDDTAIDGHLDNITGTVDSDHLGPLNLIESFNLEITPFYWEYYLDNNSKAFFIKNTWKNHL